MREGSHLIPDALTLRDGRAVVASLLRQDRTDPATGGRVACCASVEGGAAYWKSTVLRAPRQGALAAGRVLHVRYEALVTRPRGIMSDVIVFLGEAWGDAVMRHHAFDVVRPTSESSSASAARPVYTSVVDAGQGELAASKGPGVEGQGEQISGTYRAICGIVPEILSMPLQS